MSPERFLQKLVEIIGMVKAPVIIVIFVIALINVISSTFVGGHDKRENFATVIGLMIMAALIFYVDKLILWMATFFR